jgi:hypothetical protein
MKELPLSICAIPVKMALGRAEAERASVEDSLSGSKDDHDPPSAAQEEKEAPKAQIRRRLARESPSCGQEDSTSSDG